MLIVWFGMSLYCVLVFFFLQVELVVYKYINFYNEAPTHIILCAEYLLYICISFSVFLVLSMCLLLLVAVSVLLAETAVELEAITVFK